MFKNSLAIISCVLFLVLTGCGSDYQQSNLNMQSMSVVTFEATTGPMSKEVASLIMDTLTTRFRDLDFQTIQIERVGESRLKVQIAPVNPDIKTIADIVRKPNKFRLVGPAQEEILTEKDIKNATLNEDQRYKAINLQLLPDGSKKLEGATQKLVGKNVRIYIDNRQFADLIVTEPISNGAITIPGSSSMLEGKVLAGVLNSGKTLPEALRIISISE